MTANNFIVLSSAIIGLISAFSPGDLLPYATKDDIVTVILPGYIDIHQHCVGGDLTPTYNRWLYDCRKMCLDKPDCVGISAYLPNGQWCVPKNATCHLTSELPIKWTFLVKGSLNGFGTIPPPTLPSQPPVPAGMVITNPVLPPIQPPLSTPPVLPVLPPGQPVGATVQPQLPPSPPLQTANPLIPPIVLANNATLIVLPAVNNGTIPQRPCITDYNGEYYSGDCNNSSSVIQLPDLPDDILNLLLGNNTKYNYDDNYDYD